MLFRNIFLIISIASSLFVKASPRHMIAPTRHITQYKEMLPRLDLISQLKIIDASMDIIVIEMIKRVAILINFSISFGLLIVKQFVEYV